MPLTLQQLAFFPWYAFIGRCIIAALVVRLLEMSRQARTEEKLMLSAFGDQYTEYSRQTGFLTPRL